MTTLTDKQKELLSNPDVKDLILKFANWQIMGMDKGMLGIQLMDLNHNLLDAFVSQFERKPKFVTNGDGEEIFDGDYFYWVETINWSIQFAICFSYTQGKHIERTYFKSKAKAEQYINLNAKLLSVNDSIDIYDSVDVPVNEIHREEFISRAKQNFKKQ